MKRFISIFMIFVLMFSMGSSVFADCNCTTDNCSSCGKRQNPKVPCDHDHDKYSYGFDMDLSDPAVSSDVSSAVSKVLAAMRWVGYAVGVGMVIYIGIKYIMASADDKASLKNAAFKYVLGALLVVSATSIASWVFNDIVK